MSENFITIPYTNPLQDGRRKLTTDQHEAVRRAYAQLKSYQRTANQFNISKRLVYFIVHPEKKEAFDKRRRAAKLHLKYHNSERRKHYMRTYRNKKLKLGYTRTKTRILKQKFD